MRGVLSLSPGPATKIDTDIMKFVFLCSLDKSSSLKAKSQETHIISRPPDKGVYRKIIFLFLNQNICCGYSKEPSHGDGSFEHPKHMFKLMDKKIIAILH